MEYKRLTHRNGKTIEEYCEVGHCKYVDKNTCILKDFQHNVDVECVPAMIERLAELEDKIEQGTLIEQKTCENVSEMHPTDGFTCSECGITIVDYVEERVDEECTATYYEYEIKYCPNCGAKVVEE